MNPNALPKGLSYGTPSHLPIVEQAGMAAQRAHALNRRYPLHLFLAAPFAWAENSAPTRWGVTYLGRNRAHAGPFIALDWGYGEEPEPGAEMREIRRAMQ